MHAAQKWPPRPFAESWNKAGALLRARRSPRRCAWSDVRINEAAPLTAEK